MPPPNDVGYFGQSGSTFYRVLSQAIAEMAETGFDNVARLQYWVQRIRDAAVQSLVPEHILESTLNQAFRATYRRLIENGSIVKFHPGIARFTLEKVRPALRAELDRRMMVSRNLIKLNRAEAIEATVRRFAGWASSVPDGGTDAVNKRETKVEIRKTLASLPFTERRVAVDQGHKFVSNLNNILATDGGAIALTWHSHWRQAGYNYRRDHKERDGKVYVLRGNWALDQGFMKLAGRTYYDEVTAVGEEVYCFPGDSSVPFAYDVEKAYRRWFDGDLVLLTTSTNKTLRATPNHPILTPNGWVAIGALNEGDDVIEVAADLRQSLEENEDNRRIPIIADVFRAIEEVGVGETLNLSPASFHGDGANGYVDVVSPTWSLIIDWQANGLQSLEQFRFAPTLNATAGGCDIGSSLICMETPPNLGMSSHSNSVSSFLSYSLHPDRISFRYSAWIDPGIQQSLSDCDAADFEQFGYPEHALAFLEKSYSFSGVKEDLRRDGDALVIAQFDKSLDDGHSGHAESRSNDISRFPFSTKTAKIVEIKRQAWAGHVYNLQTRNGWYVVDGIITHNCRCFATYIYSLNALPPDMVTEKGRMELARAKALVGA